MPPGTIQDSRDPNSPQWGYLKVKNPQKLVYPAKDEIWNEYSMFVHETSNQERLFAGTDVEFFMVPATLTISVADCDSKIKSLETVCDNLNTDIGKAESESETETCKLKLKLEQFKNAIHQIEKAKSNIKARLGKKKELKIPTAHDIPLETTLWVALVNESKNC